jgi:hypothetical protein
MSQTAHTITTGRIVADNDRDYPADVYHQTSRATGKQSWVANEWAKGALPTHSVKGNYVRLYTGTENFVGKQYPEGHGLLQHYAHIECIRTRSGLIISDTSCYGKGWAYCSTPTKKDASFDLTTLKTNIRGANVDIYDITDFNDDVVTFDGGAQMDLNNYEWIVEEEPEKTSLRL